MESATNIYKRFRTATEGWELPDFIGGSSNWNSLEIDIPNYQTFTGQLISDKYFDDANGLRWKLLVQHNEKNDRNSRIGVFLQVNMEPDNGSHWKCEAEVKMRITSHSPLYLNRIAKDKSLTWTRESNIMGFADWINVTDRELKDNYAKDGGIHIFAQFLPCIYHGFYNPWQRNMRNLLYNETFSDMELIPEVDNSNGQPVKCHANIFVSFCESPVLEEIIMTQWTHKMNPIKIQTNLTPQAIKSLLEYIYFHEDFDISHCPQTAYDLLQFALQNKMLKLIDSCMQALCSKKWTENMNNFDTLIALNLYHLVEHYTNLNENTMGNENGDGIPAPVGLNQRQCSILKESIVGILKSKNLKGDEGPFGDFVSENKELSVKLFKDVFGDGSNAIKRIKT